MTTPTEQTQTTAESPGGLEEETIEAVAYNRLLEVAVD